MAIRCTAITLFFALALALVNCGGNDRASTVSSSTDILTAAATPASTASATLPSPANSTSEPTPASSEKLTSALLKLEDLPSGYSPSAPSTKTDSQLVCNLPNISEKFQPSAKAEATFQKSDFGPFLVHSLATYNASDAKKVMEYIGQAFKACTDWARTDAQGTKTTWHLAPLSFPKIGDETFTARMSTKDIPLFGSAQIDFVFWRRGGTVSLVGASLIGPASSEASLEELVKKADGRLSPFGR